MNGKGQYQQAIADYTEAIRLNAQEPVYYENRASAYKQLGQKGMATPDENKARQLRGK
jgi:Flp pilus assembly protein TadD